MSPGTLPGAGRDADPGLGRFQGQLGLHCAPAVPHSSVLCLVPQVCSELKRGGCRPQQALLLEVGSLETLRNKSAKGSDSAFLGPKEPHVMGLERWFNAQEGLCQRI